MKKRRDEVFEYFATGATAGPTEAVNRNIEAELSKGRGYTDEGVAIRMKVKGEIKRQQQIDAMKDEGDTDEDIRSQREHQLSTDGSLARSEKMRMKIATNRSKPSAPASDAFRDGGHERPDVAAEEPNTPTLANIVPLANSTNCDNAGGSTSLMPSP